MYMYVFADRHGNRRRTEDEFIQLASISVQHAQPHHEGKYQCNLLHKSTAHRLRVRKTVHKSHSGNGGNGSSIGAIGGNGHKPMPLHHAHGRPAATTLHLDLNEDDADAATHTQLLLHDPPVDFQPLLVQNRPVSGSIAHHHGGAVKHHHDGTRLVDRIAHTSDELFATEMYQTPAAAAAEAKAAHADDSSESGAEAERIVDATGTEWSNPVYRNASLSPEFERMLVTDSTHGGQQLQLPHHLQHLPYNLSEACLACLQQAGGGGGSGEVTRASDDERKSAQLTEAVATRTTEATALLGAWSTTTTMTTMTTAVSAAVRPPPVPHVTHDDAAATPATAKAAPAAPATTGGDAYESVPWLAGGHDRPPVGTHTQGERKSVLPFDVRRRSVVP